MIDQVAAVIILQNALDSERMAGRPPEPSSTARKTLIVASDPSWDDIVRTGKHTRNAARWSFRDPCEPVHSRSAIAILVDASAIAPYAARDPGLGTHRSSPRHGPTAQKKRRRQRRMDHRDRGRPRPRRRRGRHGLGALRGQDPRGAGNRAPDRLRRHGQREQVIVVISPGDIGSDVATTLRDAGVTMTFQSFYQLLLEDPNITFEPGNYQLQKQMSASAALAALQDPANKLINQVTIREGVSANSALESISKAARDPARGASRRRRPTSHSSGSRRPPRASRGTCSTPRPPSIQESRLYDAIKTLVDKMFAELDAAGVAPENRFAY